MNSVFIAFLLANFLYYWPAESSVFVSSKIQREKLMEFRNIIESLESSKEFNNDNDVVKKKNQPSSINLEDKISDLLKNHLTISIQFFFSLFVSINFLFEYFSSPLNLLYI